MSIDIGKFSTFMPAEYKSVIDLVVRVAEYQAERKGQTCISRHDLTDREFVTVVRYTEETASWYVDRKISHIKDLKETFGLGLAASKYFADMFHTSRPVPYSS